MSVPTDSPCALRTTTGTITSFTLTVISGMVGAGGCPCYAFTDNESVKAKLNCTPAHNSLPLKLINFSTGAHLNRTLVYINEGQSQCDERLK